MMVMMKGQGENNGFYTTNKKIHDFLPRGKSCIFCSIASTASRTRLVGTIDSSMDCEEGDGI